MGTERNDSADGAAVWSELERRALERIRALVAAAGMPADSAGCHVERHGADVEVHLTLDGPTSHELERALGVRVHDAIRAAGRTYGHVSVYVHNAVAPPAR